MNSRKISLLFTLWGAAAAVAVGPGTTAVAGSSSSPPHIVLIVLDDYVSGWMCCSFVVSRFLLRLATHASPLSSFPLSSPSPKMLGLG